MPSFSTLLDTYLSSKVEGRLTYHLIPIRTSQRTLRLDTKMKIILPSLDSELLPVTEAGLTVDFAKAVDSNATVPFPKSLIANISHDCA
jgi:hypothetical protein